MSFHVSVLIRTSPGPLPIGNIVTDAEDLDNMALFIADCLVDPRDPDPIAVPAHVLIDVDSISFRIEPEIVCHHGKVMPGTPFLCNDSTNNILSNYLITGINQRRRVQND